MTARAQKEYMDYCMLKQACIDYGKKEGIAIGEERAKLDDARNMLLKNVGSIEQIAEITGLAEEKIKELAEELKIEV
ncbi:MAG: hypothetical protein IKZ86_13675 [Spirochaetaceae bacterium]|nr:hypothetical protein [Spirochaetaceae bacterium]